MLEKNLLSLTLIDRVLAERIRSAEDMVDVEVITARSGLPTLVRKGISLHSRIDPWREADGFAARVEREIIGERTIPAVFGLGLGYHVLALASRYPGVVVIEPDPGMIKLAFEYLDFIEFMPRLRFILDRDSEIAGISVQFFSHGPSARLNTKVSNFWAARFDVGREDKTAPGPTQTAGQLRNKLASIEGMQKLLDGFGADAPLELSNLVQAARDRRGPLSEGTIYTLLLHELAPE